MKSNSLSRRRFLQSSAVASVPFILPSGILSAKIKPNDKISVGFIGMGIQNRGLQRRFMGDKNVVCVAVSDCDTTRRNAARDAANRGLLRPLSSSGTRLSSAWSTRSVIGAREAAMGIGIVSAVTGMGPGDAPPRRTRAALPTEVRLLLSSLLSPHRPCRRGQVRRLRRGGGRGCAAQRRARHAGRVLLAARRVAAEDGAEWLELF